MRQRMAGLVEQVAVAAHRRAEAGGGPVRELDSIVAVLRADYGGEPGEAAAQPAAEPDGDVLAGVSEVFELDPVDAGLLTIAAAADFDANLSMAFGLLRGLSAPARPSIALALELSSIPTLAADGFDRLGPDGPLRRHRLVEVLGSEPWLGRQLRVPDPVAAFLAGSEQSDPPVAAMRSFPVPIELAGTSMVASAISNGVPLIWIRSAAAAAGNSLAAGAFAALGLQCLAVDMRRCPADADLLSAVASAAREAGLRGCGLVVTSAELLGEPATVAGLELLERAAVPVVAVGARPWNPSWLRRFPLAVDAHPLAITDRAEVWRTGLGELAEADEGLRHALLGLRLTPEEVLETARYARMLADSQRQPLSAAVVREAARRVGGSGGTGVNRIAATAQTGSGPSFDDLVLPEHARQSLHQLVSWARVRDQVTARGPLRGKGSGIAALFTGSPGTGKTLAANVIAEELSIDLFQVDLSAIVDKYIGETEKNLEKVFQSAEALDVVLFFDEADALFGSRSEVRDSRDRYANQEVAYLLQRMEQFSGITILATNLRGNLDQAFSRRMSFIVHFPDPDPATRRRLWQSHLRQLHALDPHDPVDLDFLAESVELAGGDIRNIVLSAAYDAISVDEPIGMRHLAVATVGEYRKLGRRVPEHGFLPA
ncbi:MAG: hypothetical protein QOE23_2011 [Pseudonocardiales bacterium]|nr:hypothetical protein [Pseudonocardiales bacterium]